MTPVEDVEMQQVEDKLLPGGPLLTLAIAIVMLFTIGVMTFASQPLADLRLARLLIVDGAGRERAVLQTQPAGGAVLQLRDPRGTARVDLTCDQDSGTFLNLYGAHGERAYQRVSLGLLEAGPVLMLVASDGRASLLLHQPDDLTVWAVGPANQTRAKVPTTAVFAVTADGQAQRAPFTPAGMQSAAVAPMTEQLE